MSLNVTPTISAPPPGSALRFRAQRRTPWRGRSAILWAIAFYALAQCVMTLVVRRWDPVGMNEGWDKCARLSELREAEPDRPLLVMMGSSRTDLGFRAARLNGLPCPGDRPFLAFNYGVSGLGPLREWVCLQDMLDAGIRPRLLLLEFFPPLFNKSRPYIFSEEGWNLGQWLTAREMLRLQPYCAHPNLLARNWLRSRLASWCSYRPYLQAWLSQKLSPEMIQTSEQAFDYLGSRIHRKITPDLYPVVSQEAYRQYHSSLERFKVGVEQKRALRAVLRLCRRERIPVILVRMPEASFFRQWYPEEARKDLNDLLARYQKTYAVEVIDANEWIADWGFTDGHHLGRNGSEIFTARLEEELRRILSRGETALADLVPSAPRSH